MTQWEYKYDQFPRFDAKGGENIYNWLNQRGKDGWEAFSILVDKITGTYEVWFKRQISKCPYMEEK